MNIIKVRKAFMVEIRDTDYSPDYVKDEYDGLNKFVASLEAEYEMEEGRYIIFMDDYEHLLGIKKLD